LIPLQHLHAQARSQKSQKLELVAAFRSKAEYEEAAKKYEVRSIRNLITDAGEYIYFKSAVNGTTVKQLLKETVSEDVKFTKEERSKLHEGRTVSKDVYVYNILEEGTILAVSKHSVAFRSETDIVGRIDKGKIIYNYHGEKILDLPYDEQNIITTDPARNYLLAYTGGEISFTPALFFYDVNGNRLNRYDINANLLRIEYSHDGKHIKVIEPDKNRFLIFTLTGQLDFEYNYKSLSDAPSSQLFKIFLSDSGNLILLSMLHKMILMNKEGVVLWQVPSNIILDCKINEKQECILAYTFHENGEIYHSPKQMAIYTLASGQVLDRIQDVELMHLDYNSFIVEKEGGYREYEFK
jgi:hypothetical protein